MMPMGKKRGSTLIAILAIGVLAIFLLHMSMGKIKLNMGQIILGILGFNDNGSLFIIRKIRLPRALNGLLAGAAFALSGMLFQRVINNPLSSPDIIGIQSGASLAAVFILITPLSTTLIPAAAFLGAIGTAALIYGLSWKKGIYIPRLILIGIGMNALNSAGIQYLLMTGRILDASKAYQWMSGSLYTSDLFDSLLLVCSLVIAFLVILLYMPRLQVLQLGERSAKLAGLPVERSRVLFILVACLLSGIAVSVTGPIGFLALAVPHMVGRFFPKINGRTFGITALCGALILSSTDIAANHMFQNPVPVGLIVSAFGAPYFLFVLTGSRRAGKL